MGHFHDDVSALRRAVAYLHTSRRLAILPQGEAWTHLLDSLGAKRREAPVTALRGRRPHPGEVRPGGTPDEFQMERWRQNADYVASFDPPFSYLGV